MKTEVEINGFEISIEDIEGKVEIKVEMNDEVIEELTFDPAEYEGSSEDEELKAFGNEGEETENNEEAEEGNEMESEEAESMPEEEEEEEMMGESVKTFADMFPINKGK